ncbi:MAG: LTA synthase family protein [Planctomycetaceae bacterium]
MSPKELGVVNVAARSLSLTDDATVPQRRSRLVHARVMMERIFRRWLGPYRAAAVVLLSILLCFTVLRVAFLIAFADPSDLTLTAFVKVLAVGFQFDLLVGLCLILWQACHVTILTHSQLNSRISRLLIELEWIIAFLLLPLLCVVEWIFFDEFQSRLNYIALEYLVYPTEVCCNIWESYAVIPSLTIVGIVGGASYYLIRRPLLRLVAQPATSPQRYGILTAVLIAIAGLWGTIGMDRRNVSEDRVAVECAGNGIYSFAYYAWTCRFDFHDNYVTLDKNDALKSLRKGIVRSKDLLQHGSENPVDRIVSTERNLRDWNVVLILEESLGSDFVGVLGDKRGLTPQFDALSQEGILCDNFYATGNRTARALEAVLTSMPPLPTESILKRDHSQNVFTLAHVLAERGYERLFMTGGRGLFDGVRTFMTNNGFNRFIELADFTNPIFANAWGVSDEDLFAKAIDECNAMHETGKPFFATLLTVSNHRPYTYPAGRIPQTKKTRDNAVRYADWALGHFFREVRRHEFSKNTLFIVMGDHGARVYGSQFFPMKSYRIPVVIIPPESEEKGTRCHTLACSLDIAPTIIGQLGGSYRSVFFGHDILKTSPERGRAIMQHNHNVAVLNADHHMVVLGFNHMVSGFDFNPASFELKRSPTMDSRLVQDAIALFQSTHELYYSDRWFPEPGRVAKAE